MDKKGYEEVEVYTYQDDDNKKESVWGLFKGLFTEPVKTISRYTYGNNFGISWILTIVLGILTGLLTIIMMETAIGTHMEEMLYGSNSLESFITISNYNIPYFTIFLVTTLSVIAVLLINALIIKFIVGWLFKKDVTFKNAFNFVNILNIILIFGVIISMLAALISFSLVGAIHLIIYIVMFTLMVLSLREVFELKDSDTIYAFIILIAIYFLIALIPICVLLY